MEKGKVLIFRGGWDGHEPKQVSARFARIMEKHGYSCFMIGVASRIP